MDGWYKGAEATKLLKVHVRTLYNWDASGKIDTRRTAGNHRLYNVNKYLVDNNLTIVDKDIEDELNDIDDEKELKLCYVRVSSHSQKDDLERQIEYMKERYPKHKIIKDIGSGLNLNRRGLRKIIDLAISGKISEVVVAYKDRLARFGFELIEDLLLKYSNAQIIIVNKKEDEEPEAELVKDLLQIMNIFTSKMNGMRKYKINDKNKK